MPTLQRRLYRAVVHLHPAAFRRHFGREMLLDFDDALAHRGFAPLLTDAIFSVARQWSALALHGPDPAPELAPAPTGHPFLAGHYIAADHGHLTFFDWASASILSALLILTIGFSASIPNRRVFPDPQPAQASPNPIHPQAGAGAFQTPSSDDVQPSSSASATAATADSTEMAAHSSVRGSPSVVGRVTPAPPTLAPSWMQLILGCILVSAIIWLTSLLLRGAQTLGMRSAFAALGAISIAALVAPLPIHIRPAHAQIHANEHTGPLAFDVVSIREDKSLSPSSILLQPMTRDGYHFKAVPLYALVQQAYAPSQYPLLSFKPGQIVGAPDWLMSIRYDIDAKVSEADIPAWNDPTKQPAMRRTMLQTLLADRLKLVVHREMRTMPIFELTVGKIGPRFKSAEPLSPAEIRAQHPGAVTLGDGTLVASGPTPGQQMLFGVTMPTFAWFLTNTAGRPVRDNTGLTGKYDISYQLELLPPQQEGSGAVPPDYYSLQIHSVVEDQLGLKLTSAKGPVEVLVIDHIEKPTPN